MTPRPDEVTISVVSNGYIVDASDSSLKALRVVFQDPAEMFSWLAQQLDVHDAIYGSAEATEATDKEEVDNPTNTHILNEDEI